MIPCLLDTGPLVALLDSSEPEHRRVDEFIAAMPRPRLLTTGAVIAEAFYFLADAQDGPKHLAAFLKARRSKFATPSRPTHSPAPFAS